MAEPSRADPPRGVLITRPEAEARATAAQLESMGFTPVIAPLLRVRPLPFRPSPRIEAVLVTSGNAIPAVSALDLPLLAVGDATARRARAAGATDVASAGGDAADLLALARRRCRPGACLLLASGQGQGHALAHGLRQAGFRVHRRAVYAAAPVRRLPDAARQALGDAALKAALFLSAETARAFVHVLPPALCPALVAVDALAISERAACALAPLPWRRVRVSVAPTLEQVLALL